MEVKTTLAFSCVDEQALGGIYQQESAALALQGSFSLLVFSLGPRSRSSDLPLPHDGPALDWKIFSIQYVGLIIGNVGSLSASASSPP